jgi:hypothetical protein
MNYSFFLFSQLFYTVFKNTIEYDRVYPLIVSDYREYQNSIYNKDSIGEYEGMVSFLTAKKETSETKVSNLENLFNEVTNKRIKSHSDFINREIVIWDDARNACNDVLRQLSFLTRKGFKIDFLCDTLYDDKQRSLGYQPYLRIGSNCIRARYTEDGTLFVGGNHREKTVDGLVTWIALNYNL